MILITANLIFFLLINFIFFTIPGMVLINRSSIKLAGIPKAIIGTCLGLVLITLISYLELIPKVPLLIPLLIILNILFLKTLRLKHTFFKNTFTLSWQKVLLITVFLTGIIGQLAIIAPSGLYKNGELVFYSSHGHDSTWHIALMNEIKNGYPIPNPSIAGEKLINYHFFSDIAPSLLNKYFNFSPLDLYFRYFPLLFSFLLGALVYLLTQKITSSSIAALWAVIFTYFAGSFGYIVTLSRQAGFGGESLFWASQIQSSSGNPPQIIALILVLLFLYLFMHLFEQPSEQSSRASHTRKVTVFLSVLVGGTIIEFKSYAGVALLISLFLTGMWQLIRSHKLQIFSIFILSSIVSSLLYLPNTSNSTSFLIWEPWWYIRTMVVAPDRLNWLDLELRRQTYISEGNIKRVIQLEVTAFLIFLIGNLGMRFVGVLAFVKNIKKIPTNYSYFLLTCTTLISFILPLLFLQKGVAGNSIQFIQYFLLIMGILAGIAVSQIIKKIKSNVLKILFSLTIIVFMIPTQIGLIYDFYHKMPLAKISYPELQALDFLKSKTQKANTLISPPYQKNINTKSDIPYIWAWSDTSYIPAFSLTRSYISDQEQATIMGYEIREKLKTQEQIFKEGDPLIFTKLLKDNQINYLYFPKILHPGVKLETTPLIKIFENNEIEIWQLN